MEKLCPELTGLRLASFLPEKAAVIFTTAYAEHAVEAFNLEAADYLLKPINYERFLKSVKRVLQLQNNHPEQDKEAAKKGVSLRKNR